MRDKDTKNIIDTLVNKNIVILGKIGIGKTHTLLEVIKTLPADNSIIFDEPTTAKVLLLTVIQKCQMKPKRTKEEMIAQIKEYNGDTIYICIDQIEKTTPSLIDTLDSLMSIDKIRLVLVGHLGSKKKYNTTWLKCKGFILKELSTTESISLIETLWRNGTKEHKKIIAAQARGIPGKIITMIEEAKQGILPNEETKYFDFMPILLIIGTAGMALRIIGYGYASMEQYIIGGIIAALFWGSFWIYRGYVSGWFGGENNDKSQKSTNFHP